MIKQALVFTATSILFLSGTGAFAQSAEDLATLKAQAQQARLEAAIAKAQREAAAEKAEKERIERASPPPKSPK